MRRVSCMFPILTLFIVLQGCNPEEQGAQPAASQPGLSVQSLAPLPEYAGRITHLMLHAKTGLVGQTSKPVFDLLNAFPPHTKVTILCDDLPACNESRGRMRQHGFLDRHRLDFVRTPGPVSVWARDRYIFCTSPAPATGRVCLIPALTDRVREPARESERANAQATLSRLRPAVHVELSDIACEGGNLLASRRNVFVGANILADNAARISIRDDLARSFSLPVVLIGDTSGRVPFVHIDMFVSIIDDDRIIVASPAMAGAVMKSADAQSQQALSERLFQNPPDYSPKRQRMFDEVADQLAEMGFEVSRIPYVDSLGGDFIVTYNNVLQSVEDGRHVVYLPTYRIAALDAAAQRAWESFGCTVRSIDVAPISHLNGAIRCLANVVDRE